MSNPSWYSIRAAASDPKHAEISIHDEIGYFGLRFQDFHKDLKALGELDQITVSINSYGGEVFDGLAIYNVLNAHKANVTVRVEGIAASIASVIAMAGDEVQIPENAFLMVHNPWGLSMGDSEEMRKTADLLDKLRGSIVSTYRSKTGMKDDEIINLMDEETWMDGKEAVSRGFADTVLSAVALANSIPRAAFDTLRFHKMPAALAASNAPTMKNSATEETSATTEQVESEKTPSQQEGAAATVESTKTPEEGKESTATESAAPAQASFLQRFAAAFSGDPALRAELSNAQARITALTAERDTAHAEIATLKAQLAEFDQIKAQLAQRESEIKTASAKAAEIIAAQGFTPDEADALPAASSEADDILARFEAITDPQERNRFFTKHKARLMDARAALKKAA